MKTDTLLVHAGEPRPRIDGAVAMPIFQSSTFEEAGQRGYHDIRYARLSNTPCQSGRSGYATLAELCAGSRRAPAQALESESPCHRPRRLHLLSKTLQTERRHHGARCVHYR